MFIRRRPHADHFLQQRNRVKERNRKRKNTDVSAIKITSSKKLKERKRTHTTKYLVLTTALAKQSEKRANKKQILFQAIVCIRKYE